MRMTFLVAQQAATWDCHGNLFGTQARALQNSMCTFTPQEEHHSKLPGYSNRYILAISRLLPLYLCTFFCFQAFLLLFLLPVHHVMQTHADAAMRMTPNGREGTKALKAKVKATSADKQQKWRGRGPHQARMRKDPWIQYQFAEKA